MAPPDRTRNIAVGLVVRDGHALVELYAANPRHGVFARALGGGIEFGERADAAIRREFLEELGIRLTGARLIAVTENLFEVGGRPGHEIVHVYAVTAPELDALGLDETRPVLDSDTVARWMPLADLAAGDPPFYPDGMVALARALG